MSDILGALGLLFFLFFLVSAASEALLETLRGLLERMGIKVLKAAPPLDEAVAMATEFLPADQSALGKVAALRKMAVAFGTLMNDKVAAIQQLERTIRELDGAAIPDVLTAKVNEMSMELQECADLRERNRVFVLRAMSVLLALGLCWAADFDALQATVQAYPTMFRGALGGLYHFSDVNGQVQATPRLGGWGITITAVAAASGSSYWHDKLDKIRSLKSATEQFKRLSAAA